MTWLIALLGAVALLIWGLRMVRTAIERSFSIQTNLLIGRIGRSRLAAACTGVLGGAAMQSGTAAVTLAANLADRKHLKPSLALGIALGADLGSAIAANFLSLDVGELSFLFIFLGVLVFLVSSSRKWRGGGRGLLGLGLIFLAVAFIGESASVVHGSPTAMAIVRVLDQDPALAFLIGGVITVAAFSSIAVVILIIQMAVQGTLGFEAAIFLLLGVNAGAGILPILASMHLSRRGRLVTFSNLIMRLIFAVCLAVLVYVIGAEAFRLTEQTGNAILLVHLGINFILVAICLWWVTAIVGGIERISPSEIEDPSVAKRAVYLDESELSQPTRALSNCTRELLRAAETVHEMLARSLEAFDENALISDIRASDEMVDALHSDVTLYISNIMRSELTLEQAHRARTLFDFSTNLEHIGDIIDHNLMELARSKHKKGVDFSKEGWSEISRLHSTLVGNFRLGLDVVIRGDLETAQQLLDEKRLFRNKVIKSQSKHFDRLLSGRSDSIGSSVLHLDILRDLRRISSHLSAAAYPVLEHGGR